MEKLRLGFAMTGSYCVFDRVLNEMESLKDTYDITAILSERAASTDTRFGACAEIIDKIHKITGKLPITTIEKAETVGPKKLFDVLLIAPCTGNTLGKLANGITDTSVTMAAKAHLRNLRPLVIAPSTNDGLSGSAKNIGLLLNMRNIYFVPFGQDDPINKTRSLVADFSRSAKALEAALNGEQIQPILV